MWLHMHFNKEFELPNNLESFKVGSLPIIAHFCQGLGITKMVSDCIESPQNISSGQVVVGMIMDTLTGRSPLYHLSENFECQDMELLFGKGLSQKDFNDDNVGKVLDNIHAYGSSQLFSQISYAASQHYDLNLKYQHFDTTSVNVWGDYKAYSESSPQRPAIVHGHSKDHRPDLKQFLYSCLCIEGNIP